MHDIEQITRESSEHEDYLEFEDEFAAQNVLATQNRFETEHEDELEYEDESEQEDYLEFEQERENEDEHFLELEHEATLSESNELELATNFLEVGSETELEQFIGQLVRLGTGSLADFARSREGRQIAGILKGAAGRVLPVLHQTGGSVKASAPRMSGTEPVTGSLAKFARRYLGIEVEGLALEDQELEVARQFIRFARDAILRCLNSRGTAPAQTVAQRASLQAADRHAPGLVSDSVLAAPSLGRAVTAPAGPVGDPVISTRTREGLPSRRTATPVSGRPVRGRPVGAPTPTCHHCGAPATNSGTSIPTGRSGRWVMRGNSIILLPTSTRPAKRQF